MGKPVLFLDRDGTINVDRGYINRLEDLEFIPGALDALVLAKKSGFLLAMITNQAGVAKGLTPSHMPALIAKKIEDAAGITFDDIRICPHHPDDACDCRKPAPGNLLRSMERLSAAPEKSWFIGDTMRDVQCAQSAGIRPILLRTGHGEKTLSELKSDKPPLVCADLMAAVKFILSSVA